MNLQQLEYIVAVDNERHFVRAAEKCFITQATLSAMIKKLEDEWLIQIFDRQSHPVVPTPKGQEIIAKSREILLQVKALQSMATNAQQSLSGDLRIGIIPTMAPSVLPLFIKQFGKDYPNIGLKIKELTTDEIIAELNLNKIDIGILATPLNLDALTEYPMYYEEFVLYAHPDEPILEQRQVGSELLNSDLLWILEEGHCLRSQVINFCQIKSQAYSDGQDTPVNARIEFEAGSIDTLINLVDAYGGYTILPELAINALSDEKLDSIRYFVKPEPVREVSLITSKHFHQTAKLNALKQTILKHIPDKMKNALQRQITKIY